MRNATLFTLILCLFGLTSSKPRKQAPRFDRKNLERSMKRIPEGSFHFGGSTEMYFNPVKPTRSEKVEVASFYLSDHEVTNGEYLAFVREGSDERLPDTLVWRSKLSYNEHLVTEYLRGEEYEDHPVVGVSHDQAEAYCDWLTDRYHQEEKRKFKKVRFSLPSQVQWTYAASGGFNLARYPWGWVEAFDSKGRWRANFCSVPQYHIGRDSFYVNRPGHGFQQVEIDRAFVTRSLAFKETVTEKVDSYEPNGFGLYNMAGNVSEMVREDGISKGGSWYHTGYYLLTQAYDNYQKGSKGESMRGFRVMMEVLED